MVHPADKRAVKWALDNGYPFNYVREHGLPDPSLQVCLGLSNAFFSRGHLVEWRARAEGTHLDDLMRELTCLFGFCTLSGAYRPQFPLSERAVNSG